MYMIVYVYTVCRVIYAKNKISYRYIYIYRWDDMDFYGIMWDNMEQ